LGAAKNRADARQQTEMIGQPKPRAAPELQGRRLHAEGVTGQRRGHLIVLGVQEAEVPSDVRIPLHAAVPERFRIAQVTTATEFVQRQIDLAIAAKPICAPGRAVVPDQYDHRLNLVGAHKQSIRRNGRQALSRGAGDPQGEAHAGGS